MIRSVSLFLLLCAASVCDVRKGKIPNGLIAVGLLLGIATERTVPGGFKVLIRAAAVCAVFYPLFSIRAVGAGDVKLLAVCVGMLGTERGLCMAFFTFLSGAAAAFSRMAREGILYERLSVFVQYLFLVRRVKRLPEYQDRRTLHLGPCLLAGYFLTLFLYGRWTI